uniref:RNase H type-1 domain-containing protein n=1 Tax=Strigamia maritima TaxID=126957 RepID=T1J8R7_STRMM
MLFEILHSNLVSVRHLASVIGKLNATMLAVSSAPLHYRGLQMLSAGFLRGGSYESECSLNTETRTELAWWLRNLNICKGRSLLPKPLVLIIETDASNWGWGAFSKDFSIGGPWFKSFKAKHINILELTAVFWALKALARNYSNATIKLKMDNISAITAINKLGSPRSPQLTAVAQDLWTWAMDRDLTIVAEHIPGTENCLADAASRGRLFDSGDWKLDTAVFDRLGSVFGKFSMDLFAACHNCQIYPFFSWKPDPDAIAFDALTQAWKGGLLYAFPPFSLIAQCLTKLRNSDHPQEIVLIAPVWPSQAWFPLQWSASTVFPVLLPQYDQLIVNPAKEPHPLMIDRSMRLAAWKLSTPSITTRSFQKLLPSWLGPPGNPLLPSNMIYAGENGANGHMSNILTLFRSLP